MVRRTAHTYSHRLESAIEDVKPPRKHPRSHHARECQQRGLDLGHVAALKQIVGLKYVMRLQAVEGDGLDEVGQVLQLKTRSRGESKISTVHAQLGVKTSPLG